MSFLEARSRTPLRKLERSLEEAVARLDFENAASIRNRIATLEKLRSHLSGFRGQVSNLDFVYPVPGFRGNHRIYLIRQGTLRGDLPLPRTAKERKQAVEQVRNVFRPAAEDARTVLDPGAAAEVLLTISWFKRKPAERRRAVAPEQWLAKQRSVPDGA